jgi:hypothetical protein
MNPVPDPDHEQFGVKDKEKAAILGESKNAVKSAFHASDIFFTS